MANIINLATETKQDEIITNVVNVKETVNAVNTNVNNVNANVNANKSTLATVNANTSTTNANLGTPTSSASSSTSANAHAKLNYVNGMLSTINNNVNAGSKHAGIYKSIGGQLSQEGQLNITALSISGKGVLRYLGCTNTGQSLLVFVDGQRLPMYFGYESYNTVMIPFNSSLLVKTDMNAAYTLALYDIF